MTPAVLDTAETTARALLSAIDYIRKNHDICKDGKGVPHYQPGPACASLREISQCVSYAMADLRASAASPIPPVPGLPRARR
jgi:hypothetical protein